MNRLCACVAAVLACSGGAMAGPRDMVTLTNLSSDVPNTFGAGTLNALGSYPVKFVRIQGTLTKVAAANTYGYEALVELFPPGLVAPMVFSTTATYSYTGSIAIDTFVRVPGPPPASLGGWAINTFESYDDAAGPDSRWDTLTVTLNDGPPPAKNMGAIALGTVSKYTSLAPNQVLWYKFEVQGDVTSGGTYLDIDTEGSSIASGIFFNDTVIALYDENGRVVGYDDDSGSGNLSQLSFGSGTRPAVGGLLYDGRNGALPAGTYYLIVRAFDGSAPAVGWSWPISGSGNMGTVKINIRTNIGLPEFCAPDYNQDGTISTQDIFDFLNGWFAGCP